jgi:hypothetical protein
MTFSTIGNVQMDRPCTEGDLHALAQACEERAWELQARAWHSEAERNALREATAALLTSVARRLAGQESSTVPGLDNATVHALITDHVVHSPLQAAQYRAWIAASDPDATATDLAGPPDPAE